MSFNKKVSFPIDLQGFSVRSVSSPPVPIEKVAEQSDQKFEEGKKSAADFYLAEINKLRNEYAANQQSVLENLNKKTDHTLDQLNENLPDLVMEIIEKIIPGIELGASEVEGIVRSLIGEFADEDENLQVFLCPEDLNLLKAMGKEINDQEVDDNNASQEEDGFASAIAGIFDNLDGEEAILADLPRVKFFEDASLSRGDCQVKSKFGLLDGRIATKMRKVREELTGNG